MSDFISIPSVTDQSNSYGVNDVEKTDANNTYVGQVTPNGKWLLLHIYNDSVTTTVTYANISNNAIVTTYGAAWTARLTLTYDQYQDLTGV